jgi:dTDP-4-amino-4,6-dideoxygalactose transaminase
LQIALKALGVKGEVITTPFSYVATTACPLWEGCTVKFADIEPDTLTIDPRAVEAAITPQTEAILATHVFGNPCDVEALDAIAAKHGLAMIYDAAHAFGVRYKDKSILEYGDASMVSLHATKLMHSVEGGFVVAKDSAVSKKIEWMRRFGHKGTDDFHGVGVNAKLSELHAAMGLCCLNHVSEVFERRRVCSQYYDQRLFSEGVKTKGNTRLCSGIQLRHGAKKNYSYYPVIFDNEEAVKRCIENLQKELIFPRRYFYPVLNKVGFEISESDLGVSESIARRILCLPLSAQMCERQLEAIFDAVLQ